MTTLAVLADIHGNLPALEAVRADLAHFRVDHVVVAGDVINWGPHSRQVLERVTELGWACLRGNNEFYLLDYQTPRAPAAWSDTRQYALLPWLERQLRDWRPAIGLWPDHLSLRFADAPPLRVVHGSARSPLESIYPDVSLEDLEPMLAGAPEPVVVCGHTHLVIDRRVGRWHVLNPGTVGTPIDGRFGATYMLLEGSPAGWRAAFRRVAYDLTSVLEEFERQGFREECGAMGELVLDEFRTASLWVHPFLAWRAQHHPGEPVGPELLQRFRQVDPDPYRPPPYRCTRPNLP